MQTDIFDSNMLLVFLTVHSYIYAWLYIQLFAKVDVSLNLRSKFD